MKLEIEEVTVNKEIYYLKITTHNELIRVFDRNHYLMAVLYSLDKCGLICYKDITLIKYILNDSLVFIDCNITPIFETTAPTLHEYFPVYVISAEWHNGDILKLVSI